MCPSTMFCGGRLVVKVRLEHEVTPLMLEHNAGSAFRALCPLLTHDAQRRSDDRPAATRLRPRALRHAQRSPDAGCPLGTSVPES